MKLAQAESSTPFRPISEYLPKTSYGALIQQMAKALKVRMNVGDTGKRS